MNAEIAKGDVLGVAKIAGIMAAKKTSDLIPLCHPLDITHVDIQFHLREKQSSVIIEASVKTLHRTGAEMEALVAAITAALTIYDMCKAVDRAMVISDVKLLKKSGGKSGTYRLKRA
jgi:cyclic pyranopterin phosphate synthase